MNGKINWDFLLSAWSGKYICHECGAIMHFEDENRSSLVCDDCGHSVYIDDYGMEDEDYDDIYPLEDNE